MWSDEEISEFDDYWLLIANEAASNLNSFRKQAGNSTHDSEIYHRLTTSFNKESFLRKLPRRVIHDDLAFDTVDSIRFWDMILEANDGLVVFGCLRDGRDNKTVLQFRCRSCWLLSKITVGMQAPECRYAWWGNAMARGPPWQDYIVLELHSWCGWICCHGHH